MNNTFEVVFLGTNGSCAFNNGQRTHYGTNTPCVAVKMEDNTLVFDAGTGLCGYRELLDMHSKRIHVFLSHYHTDHLGGLLFWDALFNSENAITFYGMRNVRSAMDGLIIRPYSPVGLDVFNAKLRFRNIVGGDSLQPCRDLTVKCMDVSHPGGCLGYRLEYDGKAICYLTDTELSKHENDTELLAFAANSDLLIADTSFANGKSIRGWGHSTPDECAKLAKLAGVKRLALYHYDHMATDTDILELEKDARLIFPDTFASRDGQRIII